MGNKKLTALVFAAALSIVACNSGYKSASQDRSVPASSSLPDPQPAPQPSPQAGPSPAPAPAPVPSPLPAPSGVAGCGLTSAAFCETFNQGPAAAGTRNGDLDPTRWTTARLSAQIMSSGEGKLNPVAAAPAPQCRAGVTQTSVLPPFDSLICDPSGTKSSQLMTVVSMQNYGVNSYRPLQPFDFAGRTGKIVFDVDAIGNGLGGFIEIQITDSPAPATTFREFQNFEVAGIPKNALSIKFLEVCNADDAVAPATTMVYNNYVGTIITAPVFDHANGCAKVKAGSLSHFEIQISQNRVDVYGSDFSPDNGQTFPNFKLLYTANINLPFTRGYVHFNARNHATSKYGFGPVAVYHWDNIAFDGPAFAAPKAYSIADNTTTLTLDGNPAQNLGYLLLDGTTGKPAGMYDPNNKVNVLTFQNVNLTAVTSAMLTLNMYLTPEFDGRKADATWGLQYRLNGKAWRTYNLTQGDLASINAIAGAPLGMLSLAFNIPTIDLVAGNNTIEFLPLNEPMFFPPVIANIDLLLN